MPMDVASMETAATLVRPILVDVLVLFMFVSFALAKITLILNQYKTIVAIVVSRPVTSSHE